MAELIARLGSRQLFPSLRANAYLAHAGVSPLSLPVEEAVRTTLRELAGEGVGAVSGILSMRERLRGKLGQLLSCQPQDLAITGGTSWGILAVAQNFPWRAGDRIGCALGDFPTNVTPWQAAAAQHGLEVVFLQPDWSDLETELRRGLRLLTLSAVAFQTGLRQPWEQLARMARGYGCQVFVDCIQAAGVLPFAVGELDYVAGGAHKWLMGVEGCGYLYVHPQRQRELHQHWAGWISHQQPVDFLFLGPGHLRYDRPLRSEPQFLEIGSSAALSQAALEASLNILLELGVDRIFAHVTDYLDELESQLGFLGWPSLRRASAASGCLSLRPPPDTDLLGWEKALAERGVQVSTPDGLIRLAPHWANSREEVPQVVAAFRDVQERTL